MLETKVKKNFFIKSINGVRLEVLAVRNNRKPGGMFDSLVEEAWQAAKRDGLVTDAMLELAPETDESAPRAA